MVAEDRLSDRVSERQRPASDRRPHQGLEFVYDEHDTLLAGRSSDAQMRLKEDAHFSRNHFRLEVNPPTCYLIVDVKGGKFVRKTPDKGYRCNDGGYFKLR